MSELKNLIKPFFIAEVSSNHHNDLERCKEFIRTAKKVGCDAVKFQLFKVDQLFSREILDKSENHRNRKDWELNGKYLPDLYKICKEHDIQFSCTPFYLNAVDELLPYVDFFKIASYELLWDDLIIKCAQTGLPLILSTGMADVKEIRHAIKVARDNGCEDLTVLQCVSGYPTPTHEANLAAIKTIQDIDSNITLGWSDHTVSSPVIHRAIHKWDAKVIEFHLDIDGNGDEFKTGHCWLPKDIETLIKSVSDGIDSDGEGLKIPMPAEVEDRLWRADPTDGLRPHKVIREEWAKI